MSQDKFDNTNYEWPKKRYFSEIINSKGDITHILAQEWIHNITTGDTDPDTNAKIRLQYTLQEIRENINDIEIYLDFLRLVTGAEDYEPALTKNIDTNYNSRRQTHEEINAWINMQVIETNDTIMLPHLNNILHQQQTIIAAIADEIPKAQKLIKSNILHIAEHKKIYDNLQQTAEYIFIKGMCLLNFSETDKSLLDIEDQAKMDELRANIQVYVDEATQIQTNITDFLGSRAAIEKTPKETYTTYKKLRKQANIYDAKVHTYYQLMIKYDK